jgi:hypothetical protein
MTDQLKQAAMQQALNLIERLNLRGWILADFEEEVYASIAALKAALEQQPVQEPVAWVCMKGEKHDIDFDQSEIDVIPVGTFLYTAQPVQEPLTDDEIGFECRKHFWMHGTRFEDAHKVGFRDAEAAHGIKEQS